MDTTNVVESFHNSIGAWADRNVSLLEFFEISIRWNITRENEKVKECFGINTTSSNHILEKHFGGDRDLIRLIQTMWPKYSQYSCEELVKQMRKVQLCKVECLEEGFHVAIGKLIFNVSNDHCSCLRIERKGIVCAHVLSCQKICK